MRIISGKSRGTKLNTLKGLETRPTLDRVKESVFNIVQEKISEAVVLDLFSGSGAIGLEFVSRGAKKAILCDKSKFAIQIIKQNIEKTHLQNQIELYKCDFREMLKKISENIDIIYLDPPYKTDYIKQSIEMIIKSVNFKKSLIIIETDDIQRILGQIKKFSDIKIIDQRKYGRSYIVFVRRSNESRKED